MFMKGLIILALWCPITYNFPISTCTYMEQESSWYCANQQLKGIPILEIKDQPAKRLQFDYNDIALSSTDMNDFLKLKYRNNVVEIDFDHNSISELPENLEQVFPNLEKISFKNNKITKVKNQFNQLDNLKQLYLDNNPIERISRNAFRSPNFKMLSLVNTSLIDTSSMERLAIVNPNLVIIMSEHAPATQVLHIKTSLSNSANITSTTASSRNAETDNKDTEENN